MTKHLLTGPRAASSVSGRMRPKGLPRRSCAAAKAGWTPARRARQAALIRLWQPWRRATGPKTEAGKARSSVRVLTHGGRTSANIRRLRRIRHALRLAARNIAIVQAYLRNPGARSRRKLQFPNEVRRASGRVDRLSWPPGDS